MLRCLDIHRAHYLALLLPGDRHGKHGACLPVGLQDHFLAQQHPVEGPCHILRVPLAGQLLVLTDDIRIIARYLATSLNHQAIGIIFLIHGAQLAFQHLACGAETIVKKGLKPGAAGGAG